MTTRKIGLAAMAVLSALALAGCAKFRGGTEAPSSAGTESRDQAGTEMTEVHPDRMMVWSAHLSIQVWNVSNAVGDATAMAERQGGFVQERSFSGDASARITLRLPAKVLRATVTSLEGLGTVTSRGVEGEDVTEQYIDIDARLKNKIALRDRLKQLLDKATTVQDILAIETQLNRVQADLDSLQGRIKALQGQVEFATVRLYFERKPIPGPLGYVFKGLWWGVKKLFVIRD